MTGSQYRNVIKRSLKKVDKENSRNYANAARQIFDNCGVAFPHGGYREVLRKLMTDDYMVWRLCTYKQAQECANAGIATVGVNSDHVVVIEPENDAVYVEDTADGYADNEGLADTVDSIDIEDRMDMQFFAYTLSPVSIMPMAATTTTTTTPRPPTNTGSVSGSSSNTTTTTTPKPPASNNTPSTPTITTTATTVTTKTNQGTTVTPKIAPSNDGYAGTYTPSNEVTGVGGKIPRYVQQNWGPCFGYSIMMGDYAAHYQSSDPSKFFTDNRDTYLTGDSANWGSYAEKKAFSIDNMRAELDKGKPVIINGQTNGGTPHYGTVVGYTGDGSKPSDFILIDPFHGSEFIRTYEDFEKEYPNAVTGKNGNSIFVIK